MGSLSCSLSLSVSGRLSVPRCLYICSIWALHLKVFLSELRTKAWERLWAGVELIIDYLTIVTPWIYEEAIVLSINGNFFSNTEFLC